MKSNFKALSRLALALAVLGACTWGLSSTTTAPADRNNAALTSRPAEGPTKISWIQAAVLGVVEGITEYLPVSSTGHLILASHAMGLTHHSSDYGPLGRKLVDNPAISSFQIVIQLGAILAVVGLYRKRVGQMFTGLAAGASALSTGRGLADVQPHRIGGLRLFGLLMVAFMPAAVVGLIFHKTIEENLFGPLPVVWALAVGGVLMMTVEYFFWTRRNKSLPRTTIDNMLLWQALAIGLAQCLAMWPGTSRSMITMLAALVVGLNIIAAAEFSFLLALPTLGAATLYSGARNFDALLECAGADGLIIGLIVSAITAAIAVKAFVKWLTSHGLLPFGIYRLILAAAVLGYFAWHG